MDYSNSKLVTLSAGIAKLQTGAFKLVHVIDLAAYQNAIDDVKFRIQNNVSRDHPFYPYLSYEITEILNRFNRIKPIVRKKRAINILGTVWKWVAGTPDHHDFQIVKDSTQNLLENNNRQLIINKLTLERINNITNITNNIVKTLKTNTQVKNEYFTVIKYKLDVIKEEITNIEHALQWAKAGIVNSFILANTEINLVKAFIEESNLPYANIEEIFEFANIKIACNGTTIIYIVSVPTTKKEKCKKLLIKPIKRKSIVTKIDCNNILQCEDEFYGIKNKCQTFNDLTICKYNEIINLSNTECIPNLLRSRPANCTDINNQHIPTVEEILPGSLLLNQFNGSILVNNDTLNITGTFVVQYHNATIVVNKRIFVSSEKPTSRPLPAIVQLESPSKAFEELLTLEAIKELHLNNTHYISEIEGRSKVHLIATYSLSTIIVIATVAIFIILFLAGKKDSLTISATVEAKEIQTTTELPAEPPLKISEQPSTIKRIGLSQYPPFFKVTSEGPRI